ncbi:MAG TPA: 23S rRNA (adenine(2503)-C(2))-methyltransferase RlmN [Sandaracinaceae bacterium LLY-WYZ-13_1]|nr:23S rRNA (adenine(2503)-C(2))-methyltransferase RlmN [Sandaracinaceae bacterium LLY-WYZ-13_1]
MLAPDDLKPPAGPLERLPEEWGAQLKAWGEPRFRAAQVFGWIHRRGVTDPAAMSNLPKRLRARLSEEGLGPLMAVDRAHVSDDGTRKLLLRMGDGRPVESVLIPQGSSGADDPIGGEETEVGGRPVTQCISSQVGCAMACVFCASGMAGLKRQMSAGEIVSQLLLGRAAVAEGDRLRNVVFMGMGEPLHNYDAVARALTLMFHPDGLGFGTRRVTVSTSGLVPEIDRLGRDFGGKVQLAISLHVPDDERRSALMPINRKYPLGEVMEAVRRYPLPPRRRITIEYTLVRGYNDDLADAGRLAVLLEGLRVKVNLIPMNPVPDNPLGPPPWDVVEAFHDRLWDAGVPTFVRRRKGDDIAAACGQLALEGETKKVRVPLPVTG